MPLLEDLYAKQRARQIELLPFFYSAAFQNSTVAAGTTVTVTTGIQSDSHFVVRYWSITAYNSNPFVVATATPPLLISFFDTGSGRQLLDNPQPVQNLCGGVAAAAGTGALPFILPEPWLVRAGAVIQTSLQNLGLLTYPTVIVSLSGMKVFKFGGAGAPGDL